MSIDDMWTATPPRNSGTGASATAQGWIDLLEPYGEKVADDNGRQIVLGGRHTLWLVTGNRMDVFAVDSVEGGPWHFIGRLEPGALLIGSSSEARYALAGRPLEGCELRRIPIGALAEQLRHGNYSARGPDPLPSAVAYGVDLGLTVLHELMGAEQPTAGSAGLPTGERVDLSTGQHAHVADGVLWVEVDRGRLHANGVNGYRERETGDVFTLSGRDGIRAASDVTVVARLTRELLAAGVLWDWLVRHQANYLYGLDVWIERQRAATSERFTAGRLASRNAVHQADEALRTVAQPTVRRGATQATDAGETALAVCRLVADACGIAITRADPPAPAGSRMDPVTRITTASRIRTRPVRLTGEWWRQEMGPIVGYLGEDRVPVALLWRRGRYDLVRPAQRRRRVTAATAAHIGPEAVMFYRSLPDRPVSAWQLLRFGIRGTRGDIARLVGGGLASSVVALAVPVATGMVLGTFVPHAQTNLIVQACIAVVIANVVSAALSTVSAISGLRLQSRLDATLQAAVWDRLLRLPAVFFTRHSTGELASSAMGINTIRALISNVGLVIINASLMATANFALLVFYSPSLALMTAALLFVHTAVFLTVQWRQVRWQRELITLEHRLSDRVFQTLQGLPKLRVAGAEGFAYARWAGEFSKSRELSRRVQVSQNVVTAVNAAYVPLCTFLLFVTISSSAGQVLSLAEFLTFLTAFSATLASAAQITSAASSVGAALPLFDKIRPVLNELPEVTAGNAVPGRLSGDIEMCDVSFRYAEGAPQVLNKINFHIRAGEFVAIVGPTGCGKSTLLRLMIGFNEPTSGAVRYDGAALTQLDLTAVREQCGVVLQHSAPFSGTVMSNICGTGSYTMDEAWEAARLAGLDRDIRAMPMGMHTLVTDGATALSGGQRQRLVIAQALIRRPRILFFDEATSALDNETQAIVAESTRILSATRVVIAHRLSTIMHADRVIVLAEGRIAQTGTPADLMNDHGGLFRQLIRRQI